MATWAGKRKRMYLTVFILGLIVLVGLPIFAVFYKKPTCFDGIMNGKETGVDCGGKCARICSADFLNPIVIWSRSHQIAKGVYNLGAYIENPNIDGGASPVPYVFKLYDARGLPITERYGVTYIPAHKNVVVFENAVLTQERIPGHVTFEFTSQIPWEKTINREDYLVVSDRKMNEMGAPRLEAEIHNTNVEPFYNIDVSAVLYDINENVIAFSQTKIDSLAPNQKERVVFTWPQPFNSGVTRIEVIPTVEFK